jgi:hypothetical protein
VTAVISAVISLSAAIVVIALLRHLRTSSEPMEEQDYEPSMRLQVTPEMR